MTFNDHSDSTKSYQHTRKHIVRATEADFVPLAAEIVASISRQGVTAVKLHDGSVIRLRSVPAGYDPTDRRSVIAHLAEQEGRSDILTGVLFLDESVPNLHEANNSSAIPMTRIPFEKLCPGAAELDRFQEEFR